MDLLPWKKTVATLLTVPRPDPQKSAGSGCPLGTLRRTHFSNTAPNATMSSPNDEVETVATAPEASTITEKNVVVVAAPVAELEPEYCLDCTPKEPDDSVPAERIVIPADVVEILPTDDNVYVIGTRDGKVTRIAGLEGMPQLKSLVIRSCLISSMHGVENLVALEKLELYDNQIEYITGIHRMVNLRVLDLSFNAIRELIPLAEYVPLLEELYVAQSKLKRIEGLAGLTELRTLDLGANRIRVIEGLETNTKLKSLWLGKNKIEKIEGLSTLVNLEQLDIQNNRLTSLGDGLRNLSKLKELYLACNRISSVEGGLPQPPAQLETVDLSTNGLASLTGIQEYPTLQELWLSSSALDAYTALEPLTSLPGLTCLYLEHSPIAKDFEYRITLTRMLPTLEQLDATNVNRA